MQREEPNVILPGVVGGVIAGVVVITWFLIVDLATNQAFHTPARLASIVVGEEFTGPWPRLVAVYTVLHFGVFGILGAGTSWFLRKIEVDPGLILGAVFGVGVLNAVHYAGIMVTGTNLLTVVPVGHVTAANVLGGMLMMAYLHRALHAESPFGWSVLERYPVVHDGLMTGLVGAAAVAFWFFVVDLLMGTPFRTPAALGSAVMLGASTASEVEVNVGVIIAYSFLHIGVFALVGMAFSWLADRVTAGSGFWVRAVAILILLEGMFLGTVTITSGWVVESLGGWTILVGNGLAVATMGGWMWQKHPKLREHLTHQAVASRA